MSSTSDNRPLVPRRTLSDRNPSDASEALLSSGPAVPAYQSQSIDSVTERSSTLPPPPSAAPPGSPVPAPQAQTVSEPSIDRRVEKAAAKAQQRSAASSSARTRSVRRAKLRVVRVDPWSVTKAAFLLSIAFGIMCVVAVFLVFSIMDAAGLWDSVNKTIQGLVNQKPADAFDINKYVGMRRVMGITMLVAAIDVVLITALATLGAFLYNMSASLLGGLEVTLAEDLS
ncbi:MAG: DUF3566 domain-containing protein [Nocardioidaceae bacterium]